MTLQTNLLKQSLDNFHRPLESRCISNDAKSVATQHVSLLHNEWFFDRHIKLPYLLCQIFKCITRMIGYSTHLLPISEKILL